MANLQTLCSNTVDLSLTTLQNVWTTRVLPIGNAIVVGAILRDTTGLTLTAPAELQLVVQGNTIPMLYAVDSTLSGPRYTISLASGVAQSYALTTNPTVTAQVIANSATGTVTIDLIGYYI